MKNYYVIWVDGKRIREFDREEMMLFVKETKDYCHSLVVLMYNNQHLNIGCEEYLDGKLIYKYKEK